MLCVTTVSYSVFFNGVTVGPILPKRGLRQGDPLSPNLLCVEGMSNSLNNVTANGSIQGCKISSSASEVTRLLLSR